MNKKILSLALSGLMAFSTVFGLAGCKGSGDSGNELPGGNHGNTNNNGTDIEPGTVITDETIKSALFASVAEAKLKGLTYTAGVNLSLGAGDAAQAQKLTVEGAARIGEEVDADLYAAVESSADGEVEGYQYFLGFLRGQTVYTADGETEKAPDFTAIKTSLKDEDDPLVLDKDELGETVGVVTSPAAIKLVKNAVTLFDGAITKTEGGYALSFDLLAGAKSLLGEAAALAEAVEKDTDMTLTAFFSQKFVGDTLESLLKGITAKELSVFFPLLPEPFGTALPEATTGTAKAYVEGLLRSGAFFTALTQNGEGWEDYQTFGEVPLRVLVSNLAGEETDLGSLGLKQTVQEFAGQLEKQIVTLVLDMLSLDENVSGENVDLAFGFDFDDDKKLIGFTLDALAEGAVTDGSESGQQPDGGTSPENGMGDAMTAATESTPKVRVSVKLAATCATSPEIFSLAGCKYHNGDGTSTIR